MNDNDALDEFMNPKWSSVVPGDVIGNSSEVYLVIGVQNEVRINDLVYSRDLLVCTVLYHGAPLKMYREHCQRISATGEVRCAVAELRLVSDEEP